MWCVMASLDCQLDEIYNHDGKKPFVMMLREFLDKLTSEELPWLWVALFCGLGVQTEWKGESEFAHAHWTLCFLTVGVTWTVNGLLLWLHASRATADIAPLSYHSTYSTHHSTHPSVPKFCEAFCPSDETNMLDGKFWVSLNSHVKPVTFKVTVPEWRL